MPAPTRPASSAVSRLAAELAGLRRRLSAVENAPRLAHSSLEVAGEPVTVPDMVNDAREAVETAHGVEQTLAATRAELEQAQAELGERLGTAETELAAAEERLDDAEEQVSQAITVAGQADAAAQAAGAAAAAAQSAADTATSEAVAAQGAADDAAQAAADAAGIAAGKGKAVFGSSAPAAGDRLATTLWIDTTGGANTPKRWSGTEWVAVTDKAAVDAADAAAAAQDDATNAIAAAAAAQLKADQAHTLAGTAESNAQAAIVAASGAQTTANLRPLMLFSTAVAQGTAPQGSVWFRVNASGQVIGQWQQTAAGAAGSTWTVRQIRDEVIANLDVGKLTAGTAVVVEVVAQKIAAATAAFQTVDVANLFVTGTSTVATQVAQKIWAAKIVAQKILATEVLIGGPGANLLPDAAVTTPAAYTRSAGVVQNPTGGRSGAGAFVVTSTAATQDWTTAATAVDGTRPYLVPAQGGRRYVVEAAVRSSVAVAAASTNLQLVRYFYDAAGTLLGSGTLNFDIAVPAAAWTTVRATTPVAPEGTAYVRVGARVNAAMTVGAVVEWSDPACFLAVDSALVVDGAITAGKLAAVLVLASEVIAGNPAGNHVKLDGTGLQAFAPTPDGDVQPVVGLGTASENFFYVVDPGTGQTLAGVTADGDASFQSLDVAELRYRGRPLQDILDEMPRGLVTQIYRPGTSTWSNITSEFGLYELFVPGEAGRFFEIHIGSLYYSSAAAPARVALNLRAAHASGGDPPTPSLSSTLIGQKIVGISTANQGYSHEFLLRGAFSFPTRVLFSVSRSTGTQPITVDGVAGSPLRAEVIDLGTDVDDAFLLNDGGGVRPGGNPSTTPKRTYTPQFDALWSCSYTAGGAARLDEADAIQGYTSYYSSAGNQRAMIGFGDLSSYLAGAAIEYIDVYLYANHWFNAAGGTAVLGFHGSQTRPATVPAGNPFGGWGTSGGWRRGTGRWLRIPASFYPQLADGTYRGITLGPGSNTGGEFYGRFNGATASGNRPQIRMKYVK